MKIKEQPLYLFLTGGAGVGKSVVVRALYRYLCKEEGDDEDDTRILLCAPTGKATYNINGVTLHNAFYLQLSINPFQLMCEIHFK
jgi:ABC-type transporter Mla maintaining outer membrane lipid asymmetry ATPase subunit MlaF